MSTGVCNVIWRRVLSVGDRSTQTSLRMDPGGETARMPSNVCRVLFADTKPVNSEHLRYDVEETLAEIQHNQSKQWGIDFETETPIENHPRFQWEMVPPGEAPSFYYSRPIGKSHKIHNPTATKPNVAGDQCDLTLAAEETANISDLLDKEMVSVAKSTSAPVVTLASVAASTSASASVPHDSITPQASSSQSPTKLLRQTTMTEYMKSRKRRPVNSASQKESNDDDASTSSQISAVKIPRLQ